MVTDRAMVAAHTDWSGTQLDISVSGFNPQSFWASNRSATSNVAALDWAACVSLHTGHGRYRAGNHGTGLRVNRKGPRRSATLRPSGRLARHFTEEGW